MTINTLKLLLASIATFLVAFSIAPAYIRFLRHNSMWKKKTNTVALDGTEATITKQIQGEDYIGTPRLGGAIIWVSVFIVASFFWLLSEYIPLINKIDFVSRNQTWLIIFTMMFTGILGAIDDISSCGKKVWLIGEKGLSFKWRLLVVVVLSYFIAWWFFVKLELLSIYVPFFGDFIVGGLMIPIIILVIVTMFTTSVIDGIDGLSGGLYAIAFGAFGIIALAQDQINIAAFCFAVVGATVAFLWYNLAPAKFYNSETGLISLSTSLSLIAILTNQIFVLPIIAFPLLSAPISAFLQVLSKKYLKRKIFLVAPVHHHFQARGVSGQTVVMKYWIIGIVSAYLGTIIALAGKI